MTETFPAAVPLPPHMAVLQPPAAAPDPGAPVQPAPPVAPQVVDNTSAADRAWAEGPEKLAAMQAEVARETADADPDVPENAALVLLCGQPVHVIDPQEWFSAANTAMRMGDWDSWAEMCLAGNEYQTVWCRLNGGNGPRRREIEDMFVMYHQVTGQDVGKAPSSVHSWQRIVRT